MKWKFSRPVWIEDDVDARVASCATCHALVLAADMGSHLDWHDNVQLAGEE